jgi:L-ascorbate metabolism protein UlaG (beta-lactamase superfamily)
MKITKFGHCCLLIEEKGVRILTDPGSFTTEQDSVKNLDLVIISHEHQDHFHVDSVKKIVANNPEALIITNTAVGKLLDKEGVKYQIIEGTATSTFKDIAIEAFDHKHGVIYEDYGQVQNTGYFIGSRLFYPGDALGAPGKPVEILAVPAGGPWLKISEVIDFAKEVNPKVCFPVHDAMYRPGANFGHMVLDMFLTKSGIKVVPLELNKETEF